MFLTHKIDLELNFLICLLTEFLVILVYNVNTTARITANTNINTCN
jgi:hypothetical protein